MSLFLSYASEDRPKAEQLRNGLKRYVEVFFAARNIRGGAEWEREIDKAIRRSKVFTPVVAKASNESTWVAKETLLALDVGVPIVPALISESLPLRIVDRQFVDFRDSFETGFSDLLSALSDHMGQLQHSPEFTDRLIAKAIRARLDGRFREANAIVEQIVGAESSLAPDGCSFWRKLQSALDTNMAETIGRCLLVKETTKAEPNYYDERDGYKWTLEIHGSDANLDKIEAVVYTLHPSFQPSIQKVRSRIDNFRLQRVGYGTFPVKIDVAFVDYTALEGWYLLTFEESHVEPLIRGRHGV